MQIRDPGSWTVSFGLLIALKHLLSSVDYMQISNDKQLRLFASISSRIISVVRSACSIAVPAIMEDSASLNLDNDEAHADLDDGGLEIPYAFRVVKESALLLNALLSRVPFPDDSNSVSRQTDCVVVFLTCLNNMDGRNALSK